MTGGLLQLVTQGVSDVYINGDPQITFFKKIYRRHTNFSIEDILLNFNTGMNFGKEGECIIERCGDLVRNIYLVIDLPEIIPKLAKATDSDIYNLLLKYDIQWNIVQQNEYLTIAQLNIVTSLIDKKVTELLIYYNTYLSFLLNISVSKNLRFLFQLHEQLQITYDTGYPTLPYLIDLYDNGHMNLSEDFFRYFDFGIFYEFMIAFINDNPNPLFDLDDALLIESETVKRTFLNQLTILLFPVVPGTQMNNDFLILGSIEMATYNLSISSESKTLFLYTVNNILNLFGTVIFPLELTVAYPAFLQYINNNQITLETTLDISNYKTNLINYIIDTLRTFYTITYPIYTTQFNEYYNTYVFSKGLFNIRYIVFPISYYFADPSDVIDYIINLVQTDPKFLYINFVTLINQMIILDAELVDITKSINYFDIMNVLYNLRTQLIQDARFDFTSVISDVNSLITLTTSSTIFSLVLPKLNNLITLLTSKYIYFADTSPFINYINQLNQIKLQGEIMNLLDLYNIAHDINVIALGNPLVYGEAIILSDDLMNVILLDNSDPILAPTFKSDYETLLNILKTDPRFFYVNYSTYINDINDNLLVGSPTEGYAYYTIYIDLDLIRTAMLNDPRFIPADITNITNIMTTISSNPTLFPLINDLNNLWLVISAGAYPYDDVPWTDAVPILNTLINQSLSIGIINSNDLYDVCEPLAQIANTDPILYSAVVITLNSIISNINADNLMVISINTSVSILITDTRYSIMSMQNFLDSAKSLTVDILFNAGYRSSSQMINQLQSEFVNCLPPFVVSTPLLIEWSNGYQINLLSVSRINQLIDTFNQFINSVMNIYNDIPKLAEFNRLYTNDSPLNLGLLSLGAVNEMSARELYLYFNSKIYEFMNKTPIFEIIFNAPTTTSEYTTYYQLLVSNTEKQLDAIMNYDNFPDTPEINYIALEQYIIQFMNGIVGKFAWIEEIGYYMIDRIQLFIGDQMIDDHTGEWLHIQNKLYNQLSQEKGLKRMIGDIKILKTYDQNTKPYTRLYIPIPYFMCSTHIPMVALQHTEMKVRVKLKQWDQITFKDEYFVPTKKPILNCHMQAMYLYVESEERIRLALDKHEQLIENIIYNGDITITDRDIISTSEGRTGTEGNIDVQIFSTGQCKELIWVVQDTNKHKNNLWGDYSFYQDTKKILPCDNIALKFNMVKREEFRDNEFYTYVEPNTFHTGSDDGINVYSMALYPELLQPSGSANFSKLNEIHFVMNLNAYLTSLILTKQLTLRIAIYQKCYNILRIMSGMAGLAMMKP